MHGSERNAAPPPGPRYQRHLAEQPRALGPFGDGPADGAPVAPFASGSDGAADSGPDYGPEVEAQFDSECSEPFCSGGGLIYAGDHIRADGDGGWVHSECAEED